MRNGCAPKIECGSAMFGVVEWLVNALRDDVRVAEGSRPATKLTALVRHNPTRLTSPVNGAPMLARANIAGQATQSCQSGLCAMTHRFLSFPLPFALSASRTRKSTRPASESAAISSSQYAQSRGHRVRSLPPDCSFTRSTFYHSLFQTHSLRRVSSIYKARLIQFAHDARIYHFFGLDLANLWIARFQHSLHVAQAVQGWERFAVDAFQ